jgi:hypothetical protein
MTQIAAIANESVVAPEYDEFRSAVQLCFAEAREHPLFTTDSEGLYAAFLAALPPEWRRHYTCNNCRHFVERFGGLVEIDDTGKTRPALWDSRVFPEFYKAAVEAIEKIVSRAKVTGVFLSEAATWGVPENVSGKTGVTWTHLFVKPKGFKCSVLRNAEQSMAEKREEFGMLQRGLAEFDQCAAMSALSMLKGGHLARSEKALGVAEWFVALHEKLASKRGRTRNNNLVWLAVATAPVGFAHVRASMIGTLLEDVRAGLAFDDIKRKWDEKMDPLQYMRPQSAPSAGNIAQAEKIIAALKSAGALDRRFARLDEVQAIWRPEESEPAGAKTDGVFSHLTPKGRARAVACAVAQPMVTMSFEKFRREVLPEACAMYADVPAHGNFIALVTAANPDAPPILQWDVEGKRNPVNWYVWPGGSRASSWSLAIGWGEVTAITLLPAMWHPEVDHGNHGKGAILILKGCKETRFNGGIALFPEVLKGEYREVRKTIEAYSRAAQLSGREEMSACGLDLRQASGNWNQRVRVVDRRGTQTIYNLDRWD